MPDPSSDDPTSPASVLALGVGLGVIAATLAAVRLGAEADSARGYLFLGLLVGAAALVFVVVGAAGVGCLLALRLDRAQREREDRS